MTNEEKMLDILAAMSLRLDSMATKEDIVKIRLDMETEIIPRIDALAEGQDAMLEQLVPVARVDELENRVKTLEAVTGNMADDLQALRKAQ